MTHIRRETVEDYRIVENLTREAFWNVYQPGCEEHYVLHMLRSDPAFIPELDCVMEKEGEIIAHIAYCRVSIERDDGTQTPAILFGPVSVAPAHQRMGYGSQLIRHTLDKARSLGYGAVVITGSPQYYHRFGFESSSRFGVYLEGVSREEEAPFSMALELQKGSLKGAPGVIVLPKVYECNPVDVECFDAAFPPKTKERRPGQLR